MATWILVYTFLVPGNLNFNNPLVMDTFTSREQCESTLHYINTTYREQGIKGSGYCWGEERR